MVPRRAFLALTSAVFAGCSSGPLLPVPRIADQSCPPLDLPERRAVCSHTDTPDGIDLSTSPSAVSTATESLESVRLLVENGLESPLRYDPSSWRLYRNAGLGWNQRGETYGGPREVETMPPGGSASWSGIDGLFRLGTARDTPAGLYAAVLPVQPEEGSNESGGPIACVFLFRVVRD
jgi:hypothetical protein